MGERSRGSNRRPSDWRITLLITEPQSLKLMVALSQWFSNCGARPSSRALRGAVRRTSHLTKVRVNIYVTVTPWTGYTLFCKEEILFSVHHYFVCVTLHMYILFEVKCIISITIINLQASLLLSDIFGKLNEFKLHLQGRHWIWTNTDTSSHMSALILCFTGLYVIVKLFIDKYLNFFCLFRLGCTYWYYLEKILSAVTLF